MLVSEEAEVSWAEKQAAARVAFREEVEARFQMYGKLTDTMEKRCNDLGNTALKTLNQATDTESLASRRTTAVSGLRLLTPSLDRAKNILINGVCAYCEAMGMEKSQNPRPADIKMVRSL